MSRQLITTEENISDSSQKNILVLREDIINSWKWSEKIQNEIKELKLEIHEMLKLIKRNEELVRTVKEMVTNEDIIEWNTVIENTHV